MSAKQELFTRLQYLNAAANLPVMVDQGIVLSEHNGVANLLRKGLGIVAFNILEDYIKNKSIESLATLSSSRVAFTDLTEYLQNSSIFGALDALAFRASIGKKGGVDLITLIQDESLKIHSTKNGTFELSKFSLVSKGSNVSDTEVSDLIKAFGVSGGWEKMKFVSDKIGGGLPDLSQAYKNAASRRHNAAHSATFQYDFQWLSNVKDEILAIAAALDILLTARCRQVISNSSVKMDSHNINDGLNFRFLERKEHIYRETIIIGGKSRKNWTNIDDAINGLQPHLVAKKEFLIVLNSARRIENWFV